MKTHYQLTGRGNCQPSHVIRSWCSSSTLLNSTKRRTNQMFSSFRSSFWRFYFSFAMTLFSSQYSYVKIFYSQSNECQMYLYTHQYAHTHAHHMMLYAVPKIIISSLSNANAEHLLLYPQPHFYTHMCINHKLVGWWKRISNVCAYACAMLRYNQNDFEATNRIDEIKWCTVEHSNHSNALK